MRDELKAQVLIGDDAETFFASELGRTVLGMAKQDEEMAVAAFDEADPTDYKAIAKIQQDLRVAKRFEQYLTELITKGREALQAWSHQNES